ncbi:MAG: peptidoglycan editing factor PgeF [Chromatiales bacterium]
MGWIAADWPAPSNVHALTTLRTGGRSAPPYASLNLATHGGDRSECVAANRRRVAEAVGLPAEPVWLEQHHGTRVVDAVEANAGRRADGAYTERTGLVCAVLTADCLPILVCDRAGTEIAALHGGWRGLAGGIIENGVMRMRAPRAELLAWLGPAISAARYEVDERVRNAFAGQCPSIGPAFTPTSPGHYLCDLYAIARTQLAACDIHDVYAGSYCTHSDAERFYSHRRDGETGRMASLIWMEPIP